MQGKDVAAWSIGDERNSPHSGSFAKADPRYERDPEARSHKPPDDGVVVAAKADPRSKATSCAEPQQALRSESVFVTADPGLVSQVRNGCSGCHSIGPACRQEDKELLDGEPNDPDRLWQVVNSGVIAIDERYVKVADDERGHQLLRFAFIEKDLDVGVLLEKVTESSRHDPRAGTWKAAQPDDPACARRDLPHLAGDPLEFREHITGESEKQVGSCSRSNAPSPALEERHANRALESCHLLGDR